MFRLLLLTSLLACGTASAFPKTRGFGNKGEAQAASKDIQALNANQRKALWQAWKAEHGKDYADGSLEDNARFAAWSANLNAVARDNQNPGAAIIHGLNSYSDMTFDEFKSQVLMPDKSRAAMLGTTAGAPKFVPDVAPSTRKLMQTTPPLFWDWRSMGKVPAVRDQGGCSSCWAFAAIGAIEIKSKIDNVSTAPDASEQQMVDCVTASYGCSGGYSDSVFNYVNSVYAATEASYPYAGVDQACKTVTQTGALTVAPYPGYQSMAGNATTIMKAVSTTGPVVIYFNVLASFQSYSSGIYLASQCDATSVNHAMLIVGYKVTAGINSPDSYWIIRNSWNTWWGESGYARVQMTNDNVGACAMYSGPMLPSKTAFKATPSPSPSPSPSPPATVVKTCKGRKCRKYM